MQKAKHLLSLCAIVVFAILALASSVNKLHYGAFNYNNMVEDKAEKRNYLVQNDGTKIYGDKITWKSGLLTKDQIQIDGQKYKITEIRGYRNANKYYARLGKNDYIQRIVHGKINVYVNMYQVTSTNTGANGRMTTSTYTRTDQYVQKGEDGELKTIANQSDMKAVVSDCPVAVQMLDLSNSKMRKAIRKDPNYLNSAFETYNNDCKPAMNNYSKN